jgi:hypothetical protein
MSEAYIWDAQRIGPFSCMLVAHASNPQKVEIRKIVV